jgi:hypothetical protein
VPIDEDEDDEKMSPVKNRRGVRHFDDKLEILSNKSEEHLSPAKGAINLNYELSEDENGDIKKSNKRSPEKLERMNSANQFKVRPLSGLRLKQITPRRDDDPNVELNEPIAKTEPIFNSDRRKLVLGAVMLAFLTVVVFSLITVTNMTAIGLILVYKCLGVAAATNIALMVPITWAKMYSVGNLTLAELSSDRLDIIENMWV